MRGMLSNGHLYSRINGKSRGCKISIVDKLIYTSILEKHVLKEKVKGSTGHAQFSRGCHADQF
jgi:hypothetical protein